MMLKLEGLFGHDFVLVLQYYSKHIMRTPEHQEPFPFQKSTDFHFIYRKSSLKLSQNLSSKENCSLLLFIQYMFTHVR